MPCPSTVTFTPYSWLPWITGDTTIKGRQFDIDVTPWEIVEHLDDLDFMWMSYMEARRGPVGLFTDIVYAKFSGSKFIFKSKTLSPHVSGSLGAALSAEYEYAIVEVGGAYEVATWGSGATDVDLLAGARQAARRHRVHGVCARGLALAAVHRGEGRRVHPHVGRGLEREQDRHRQERAQRAPRMPQRARGTPRDQRFSIGM